MLQENHFNLFISSPTNSIINNAIQAMPRPFPFPISVGTDICSISRIHNLLLKRSRRKLFNKILTSKEFELQRDRIEGLFETIEKEPEDVRDLRDVLKTNILIKRKELSLKGNVCTREAMAIKDGTDAEPMRVGDVHILKMLLDTCSRLINGNSTPGPVASESPGDTTSKAAEFLAGRYVVLTMLLISPSLPIPTLLYIIAYLNTDGPQKKLLSKRTTLVD
jgi:hypothetical protein